MCASVKKPPKDHKSILRKLFPSTSSSSSPGPSNSSSASFDPYDDCVFVKEQKAKKKASKSKTPVRMKYIQMLL